ncbi:MAG: chalcone isomerase family protein [Pseudomonadota bacterium]
MTRLLVAISLLIGFQAQAKVQCGNGVSFDKSITVTDDAQGDVPLVLNGVGKKRVLFFDVFYAALYLEEVSTDAVEILDSEQLKVGIIHATRNITKKQLTDLFDEEYQRLCDDKCEEMLPAHEKFMSYARAVKKNERLALILFADRFEFEINQNEFFDPIYDVDYADFLSRMLIGPEAADDKLKDGLLGKTQICR